MAESIVYGSCFGDGMVDDVQIKKQTELDRAKGFGRKSGTLYTIEGF